MRLANRMGLSMVLIIISAWGHYGVGIIINAPQKCEPVTDSAGKLYPNCAMADLQVMLLASWCLSSLAIVSVYLGAYNEAGNQGKK